MNETMSGTMVEARDCTTCFHMKGSVIGMMRCECPDKACCVPPNYQSWASKIEPPTLLEPYPLFSLYEIEDAVFNHDNDGSEDGNLKRHSERCKIWRSIKAFLNTRKNDIRLPEATNERPV